MIMPVRCFSCGKPIAHLWEEYKKKVDSGEDTSKALEELDLERYCCRGAILGHSDILSEVTKFKKA